MEHTKAEYLHHVFGGVTDQLQKFRILYDNLEDARLSGSVKLALPYEAPNHPPLPSVEEIKKAWETDSLTRPAGQFAVCRIGPLVVKFGPDIRILQEAENLLYLEKHSEVRAPKLYAAYKDNYPHDEEGLILLNFMVMEFIDGTTMTDEKFEAMEERDQQIIFQRLVEQLQLLRSVKPEGRAYYGRVNYQGWSRLTTFLKSLKPGFQGPYDTYEDFISAFFASTELRIAIRCMEPNYFKGEIKYLNDFKRVLWPSKHREPVFTHFDIKWTNIIVRPIKTSADGEPDDWEMTLIDWDHAGWAPAYMQKVSLFQRLDVPQELREQEIFCGYHRDQYKEETDVLMYDAFTLGLL
ncbi:hypothetical protein P171DRAFT_63387 [Karstenula rhodostoma CBS 690.94]|uniref:Aminoglycoside phosphotransferase domain-containing protein n=1 Tax=Karstenula rhodostoma CBS 690.94 TaxID=1392251 RepID=A0A9P4U9I3_9PLEO|nr:hypothetical protein P171DRAFT_63387 [Karstenula rhodostoma CBS 690.94]